MTAAIPTFPHCEITRDTRGAYTATITNARSLNILGTPVIESVTGALRWLAAQPDARCVVLRGSGERAFVGGADIHEMAGLDPAGARAFITRLAGLCEAARAIPVPTIARCAGFCLGGGLELAAACDIRLASEEAVFGMPEVRVGIPSVIHAALLPRLIGEGATNWLLLTGETVAARQALAWGFVQFLCPEGGLDALVERTVAPIVASGPGAIRQQKHLLRYWQDHELEAGIARSIDLFEEAFATEEPATYMAPFLNRKRSKPAP